MTPADFHFPKSFVWGAATSSYQIEGAAGIDGRGSSIWDDFCRLPRAVANGDNGDIACDHYNRYLEDVALLGKLGVDVYRFSVAWPRLFPAEGCTLNLKGIDFYNRLIDALLEVGITPWATLYHWDLPSWAQAKGGWEDRRILDSFEEYATAVGRAYGDRVKNFIVINEPSVTSYLGHYLGVFAPGRKGKTALIASSHHQNVAHGLGVRILRSEVKDANLGSSYTYFPVRPQDPAKEEDQQAARIIDAIWTRNYIDPAFIGSYPEMTAADFAPFIKDGDMEMIATPVNYMGINHYNPNYACADDGELGARQSDGPEGPRTDIGWLIEADGFRECFIDIRARYGNIPVYVTENGMCENSLPDGSGEINDTRRIRYMNDYIGAMAAALRDGCDIRGYFSWSLMDNFEWAHGFSKRFGLVYVDYATLRRTPKSSYFWYNNLIAAAKIRGEDDNDRKDIAGA